MQALHQLEPSGLRDLCACRCKYARICCAGSAVFGLLGATADKVGGTDATASAGFTRIGPDPWLWP
jgi:hypothetical protein